MDRVRKWLREDEPDPQLSLRLAGCSLNREKHGPPERARGDAPARWWWWVITCWNLLERIGANKPLAKVDGLLLAIGHAITNVYRRLVLGVVVACLLFLGAGHWAQEIMQGTLGFLGAQPRSFEPAADPAEINSTPLYVAASKGQLETVRWLVEEKEEGKNIDLNIGTGRGSSPLHAAARYRHPEVLELLIRRGASINAIDQEGRTPLHEAVQSGDLASVRQLLDHGAVINVRDHNGFTPLHTAAQTGSLMMARLLVEEGRAEVGIRDNAGNIPLREAERKGHADIVLFLKSHSNSETGSSENTVGDAGHDWRYRVLWLGVIVLIGSILWMAAKVRYLAILVCHDVNAAFIRCKTPAPTALSAWACALLTLIFLVLGLLDDLVAQSSVRAMPLMQWMGFLLTFGVALACATALAHRIFQFGAPNHDEQSTMLAGVKKLFKHWDAGVTIICMLGLAVLGGLSVFGKESMILISTILGCVVWGCALAMKRRLFRYGALLGGLGLAALVAMGTFGANGTNPVAVLLVVAAVWASIIKLNHLESFQPHWTTWGMMFGLILWVLWQLFLVESPFVGGGIPESLPDRLLLGASFFITALAARASVGASCFRHRRVTWLVGTFGIVTFLVCWKFDASHAWWVFGGVLLVASAMSRVHMQRKWLWACLVWPIALVVVVLALEGVSEVGTRLSDEASMARFAWPIGIYAILALAVVMAWVDDVRNWVAGFTAVCVASLMMVGGIEIALATFYGEQHAIRVLLQNHPLRTLLIDELMVVQIGSDSYQHVLYPQSATLLLVVWKALDILSQWIRRIAEWNGNLYDSVYWYCRAHLLIAEFGKPANTPR